ncbi:acetyltransferase, partial [Bacteroides uniformis]|nr:acetyltransferase [Bacteroides uniformis]
WIGAGAVINHGVKIGKWTIIGSGSVVCKDIPDGVTACGSPCRIIKNNPQP